MSKMTFDYGQETIQMTREQLQAMNESPLPPAEWIAANLNPRFPLGVDHDMLASHAKNILDRIEGDLDEGISEVTEEAICRRISNAIRDAYERAGMLEALFPGTEVALWGDVQARVDAVTVRGSNIVYTCSWWAGNEYRTAEFGEDEIVCNDDPLPLQPIGFRRKSAGR